MAPTRVFINGEALEPGSHITFGSFDFVATSSGELRPANYTIDALAQGMGSLRLAEPPRDVVMVEAEPLAPACPDIGLLVDCASALLHPSSTSEEREQVLYTLANVAT